MSVAVPTAQALRLSDDPRGTGWVVFAAAMLILLGCTNTIEGASAASGSRFFAADAHFLFADLQTWGWVIWIVGVAQGLAGLGVLLKNQLARWFGVGFAFVNGLAQLLVIQADPFWSLALFSLDVLVIYGLVVYGGRSYRPA